MQGLHLDDIPFAKRMDYIRLTAITYQSFGLDKKQRTSYEVLYFLEAPPRLELGDQSFPLIKFFHNLLILLGLRHLSAL